MFALTLAPSVYAEDLAPHTEQIVAEQAKAAWETGATKRALDLLEQGLQDHPEALALHKLRGDMLATSRHQQEAVAAYQTVLTAKPAALDVRWAKWSVFVRTGQAEEAVTELQHIAEIDARNPLVHLRLAHELRKLDRLEESLESYQKAIELAPKLLSWRLGMARTRFDVLDYQGAINDVHDVLRRIPPGSPLEIPANNLLAVLYGAGPTKERGRRFDPIITPDVSAAQLQEWASIRADAWRLFAAGRFAEAEPIYQRVLALNPRDPTAAHQLGLTLVQLGRCKEAVSVFQIMSGLEPSDEEYADAVFRMGQCLVELERWEEAFVHFKILYDAAVEFEESNKGVQLPPGTRKLDKAKLAEWLEKIRPHVPDLAKPKANGAADRLPPDAPAPPKVLSSEELYALAMERLKPQSPLDSRTSLAGRDSDFSWFRFVIPASKVMRDDSPTGFHEYIPLNPGDSFSPTQTIIYLVFGLVTTSYDEVPLSARCFVESAEQAGDSPVVAQDQAIMSMNDQSGYFMLFPPSTGWTPGLYRCGLFAGERTSAYTHVDEVRFRITEPPRPS